MIDFDKFFNSYHKYYLKSLTFDHDCFPSVDDDKQIILSIVDEVKTEYNKNNGVLIEFCRKLQFAEDNPPLIEVSFCAEFTFKDNAENEMDWENINLAKETVESDCSFLNNLASRASLLIAEVTSSYGQKPIVTPPNISP